MKRQKLRKSAGILLLEKLAQLGVKFFCFTGANGSGKDLQGNLAEILMLWNTPIRIAHVSTSAAIKNRMSDDGNLGIALKKAQQDWEKDGSILFPDTLALHALALDVAELHGKKHLNTFILTGVPRGDTQPWLMAEIPNCQFVNFNIGMGKAISRAMKRTKQRLSLGLKPREDDHGPNVIKRWKNHYEETLPSLIAAGQHFKKPVKKINGEQPIRAVLADSLQVMGLNRSQIENCLTEFEMQKIPFLAEIMKGVEDEPAPVPDHWPVPKKIEVIKARIAKTHPKPIAQAAPTHVEVVDKVESTAPRKVITNPKWQWSTPFRRTFMATATA